MVTRVLAKNTLPKDVAGVAQAELSAAAVSAGREAMSKVDTAWLRMDSPSNLMLIVGVWVLRPGLAFEALQRRLQERLLRYPRFVQCVQETPAGCYWVPDPDFRIEHHLVRETLTERPGQSAQQALQERLGELSMQPLDRKHPLWQFHLVEDYLGGSAMLVRIHHCIADGIALIGVTQTLVDGSAPVALGRVARDATHALPTPLEVLRGKALAAASAGMARTRGWIAEPEVAMHDSADWARQAYHAAQDLAALTLMGDDSPTRLKGTPGHSKRVAWCAPLPLDEVKAVSKALSCSVNDVLLSCVSGALAAYLQHHGDATQGQEIRAMVPVNLRAPASTQTLGNQFGLAPLLLPLGQANPLRRLYMVRARMQALKGSMQPVMAFGLLALAGLGPKPLQDAMLGLFSRKTTAVMTNVPGPATKLQLCGSTVEESLFWVPQTGSVGLGVSILSYGGGVQFGVVSDATLCPDPQRIIDGFAPEFERLVLLTLMLPWSGQAPR